jgi:hypothetical protein
MNKNLIFVSGTGRSGTHLIGRTISSHEEIEGRIEISNTFNLITQIATTQDFKPSWKIYILKLKLRRRLKRILHDSNRHVLEKSHPSLWLVDFLIKEFNAKFVFVYRDVEPTVSSMLEHGGVLSWFKALPLNKPNRFLGINQNNSKIYHEYKLEEKCALRWRSHYDTIFNLNKKYPDNTFIMKYDDFMVNPQPITERLSLFLEVTNNFVVEKIKTNSLDKWKTKLNDEQLRMIRKISLATTV